MRFWVEICAALRYLVIGIIVALVVVAVVLSLALAIRSMWFELIA